MIRGNSTRVFTLDRSNCCVLAVDMQDRILSVAHDKDRTLERAVGLVKGENVQGIDTWYHSKVGNYVWSWGITRI